MSQVEIARKSKLQARIAGPKARLEESLRTFEWTWTKAVVFSVGLVFFLVITAVVIPSLWMYFAEQKLGWGGPTDLEAFLKQPLGQEGLLELRDAVAMGLTVGPIVTVLVVAAALQNWRKKLRGSTGESRPSGGYR